MKNFFLLVVVAALLTVGAAPSWAQDPRTNDVSDGNGNTGGGSGALLNNNGTFNTAYGHVALQENFTGILNTAIGQGALTSNIFGVENTAVGAGALTNNVGPNNCSNCGNNNTAIGFQAMFSNGSPSNNGGSFNTAMGNNALFKTDGISELNEATSNTGIGNNALTSNTIGSFNTAVGDSALLNVAGNSNFNIAIGANAGKNLTTGANNIYLGSLGVATESNTLRLGAGQTRTFVAGVYAAHATARQVFVNSNGQLGTLASSARYKHDIHDMDERSGGLFRLRPVTFRYNFDSDGERQYGLIAEEVEKIYPELVTRDEEGKPESVQYHELIPMLLNELQHQQRTLDAQAQQLAQLTAENARLQVAIAEQNAVLAARLQRLEAAVQSGGIADSVKITSVNPINSRPR
ncbi:MAG TPA: tail fiber domain-containing protein [Terriglobales bacterium]|nr:tail fiber domain-containing protein [Terriglobales bacterium]